MSARRSPTSRGSTRTAAGRRSLAAARTPARATRSAAERPRASSWARCSEVIRTEPSPLAARGVEHREHVRRADRHARRDEQDRRAGRRRCPRSGVTRSPRPSMSAIAPARKNGTSEPIEAAARARRSGSRSAPHASSAPCERRGPVRRPAREAGRDRDVLLEPCRERVASAAGPGPHPPRRGRPRSRARRGCRPGARCPAHRRAACRRGLRRPRQVPGSADRRGPPGRRPSEDRGIRRRVVRRRRGSG